MVCWMSDKPLRRAGRYAIKHTTRSARAIVEDLRYRIDVNTLHRDEYGRRAGPQPDRPRAPAHQHAAAGRRVPPQPHHRLVHPHRRGHQRHRRRRHDRRRRGRDAASTRRSGPYGRASARRLGASDRRTAPLRSAAHTERGSARRIDGAGMLEREGRRRAAAAALLVRRSTIGGVPVRLRSGARERDSPTTSTAAEHARDDLRLQAPGPGPAALHPARRRRRGKSRGVPAESPTSAQRPAAAASRSGQRLHARLRPRADRASVAQPDRAGCRAPRRGRRSAARLIASELSSRPSRTYIASLHPVDADPRHAVDHSAWRNGRAEPFQAIMPRAGPPCSSTSTADAGSCAATAATRGARSPRVDAQCRPPSRTRRARPALQSRRGSARTRRYRVDYDDTTALAAAATTATATHDERVHPPLAHDRASCTACLRRTATRAYPEPPVGRSCDVAFEPPLAPEPERRARAGTRARARRRNAHDARTASCTADPPPPPPSPNRSPSSCSTSATTASTTRASPA